jgi:rubrerythrin
LKFPHLFLTNLPKEHREFLNLLELTAKVHGETKNPMGKENVPIWDEEFHQVKHSATWKKLSTEVRNSILVSLSQKILQEAYFIECAGMAYAAKMNLSSRTKEERQFYCFVGEEEAKHLRMVESLANFNTSLENIPSFALLIGEIIQEAQRTSHLLLIQILLEGWGLNYYKALSKSAKDENVANAFKAILKDEIRHHSAGMILFNTHKKNGGMSEADAREFMGYFERIAFMVKVGPWNICDEVFRHMEKPTRADLRAFLKEIDAEVVTSGKMELLGQLISKSLPQEVLDEVKTKGLLTPLNLEEMTEVLAQSISGTFQLEENR